MKQGSASITMSPRPDLQDNHIYDNVNMNGNMNKEKDNNHHINKTINNDSILDVASTNDANIHEIYCIEEAVSELSKHSGNRRIKDRRKGKKLSYKSIKAGNERGNKGDRNNHI